MLLDPGIQCPSRCPFSVSLPPCCWLWLHSWAGSLWMVLKWLPSNTRFTSCQFSKATRKDYFPFLMIPANDQGSKPWLSINCVSLMKAVSVAGPDSITSKPLKSDGVNSATEPRGLRGRTSCRRKREHCFLQEEGIQFRQGKSNTYVHIGLPAGCIKEQHKSSIYFFLLSGA